MSFSNGRDSQQTGLLPYDLDDWLTHALCADPTEVLRQSPPPDRDLSPSIETFHQTRKQCPRQITTPAPPLPCAPTAYGLPIRIPSKIPSRIPTFTDI